MRFMLKPYVEYHDGDRRYIKRFALFPIKIDREIRWLETCYICQTYCTDWDVCTWTNYAFVSEDAYNRWKNKRNII